MSGGLKGIGKSYLVSVSTLVAYYVVGIKKFNNFFRDSTYNVIHIFMGIEFKIKWNMVGIWFS